MGQKDPVKLYRDRIQYRFYIGISSFHGKADFISFDMNLELCLCFPYMQDTILWELRIKERFVNIMLDGLFNWGDDLL